MNELIIAHQELITWLSLISISGLILPFVIFFSNESKFRIAGIFIIIQILLAIIQIIAFILNLIYL
jgi:hypothetical protein